MKQTLAALAVCAWLTAPAAQAHTPEPCAPEVTEYRDAMVVLLQAAQVEPSDRPASASAWRLRVMKALSQVSRSSLRTFKCLGIVVQD